MRAISARFRREWFAVLSLLLLSFETVAAQETKADTRKTASGGGKAVRVDACELLTKQEAEAILGQTAKDPKKQSEQVSPDGRSGFTLCGYEGVGKGPSFSILARWQPGQNAKTAAEQVKSEVGTSRDVQGLGDVAFWSGGQMHVFRGPYYLIVSVLVSRDSEALDLSQKVASKAVARLP
jgi:hypothetical protein